MTDDAKRRRRKPYDSKVSPSRKRWVTAEGLEFVHYEHEDGQLQEGEGSIEGWGNTHILSMVYKSRRIGKFSVNLTELTVAELDATKKLFDAVFTEARKTCELRDKLAQEAFDNGKDDYFRLYRPLPVIVER